MKIVSKDQVIKNILVLSDLHIRDEDIIIDGKAFNFQKFQEKMEKYVKENPFDYLIFAGDLTDKHNVNGFNSLRNLIKALKLANKKNTKLCGNENVISCPGNHDQYRNRLDSIFKLLAKLKTNEISTNVHDLIPRAILDFATKEKKQDNYFQAIKKIHSEKFERYIKEWIEKIHKDSPSLNIRKEPGYTINFGNLLFTSINSAWFCDFPDHRVNDEGHLILGINYVKKAMQVPNPENLDRTTEKIPRIVIMHHPPEAFKWDEVYNPSYKENTFKYLTDNSSIIISGHVHGEPRTLGYDQNAYLISNGTSFNANMKMSFTSLELNINSGVLKVWKNNFEDNNNELSIITSQPPQEFNVPFIEKKHLIYC
jgi:predicted phosphodiesterase